MSNIKGTISFFAYRYKFLALYTIFGVFSLIVELLIIRTLLSYHFHYYLSTIIGFLIGLLVAFFLNIRFNFHISPSKRRKALLYFTLISLISFCIQLIFRNELVRRGMSFDLSRFVISGIFFFISYSLHRRFSFVEYKKVGVAIYADGVEDIKKIYDNISNVCDFIHIDIVDKTFNKNCSDVKAYRAEAVRAYWQDKLIEVHIMSRNPFNWLPDILPYVDIVYVHLDIDDNLHDVIAAIRQGGCKPGLTIGVNENVMSLEPYLHEINHILVLSIKNPGYSGQKFEIDTLQLIEALDQHERREHFSICVDGGVNDTTIKYLNVESVVSGSFVLTSENPVQKIMYLQTSGEYEKY